MPVAQPLVKRQTIKQAKADFKARGRPTVSDLEKKQIERAAQLERRAWGAKERAKSKTETLRKKRESERREQEDRERARMGTQRRCDRFGHKSSQLHLGGFFGPASKGIVQPPPKPDQDPPEVDSLEDGVDDESLLEALEWPGEQAHQKYGLEQHPLSVTNSPTVQRADSHPCLTPEEGFSNFWAEPVSYTHLTLPTKRIV